MPSVLWIEKYAPNSLEEFIGNQEIVKKASLWALEWKRKCRGKPLLFFGATGTGKTLLSYLLAREHGWGVFELNASDFRTKEIIEKIVGAAAFNASFSGNLRLVLLDEVDNLHGSYDKGAPQAILQILKESQNPVILTANDIYSDKKLASIRSYCTRLEFKKPNYLSIAKYLKQICEKEQIDYDLEAVNSLARSCHGDIRSAVLDLQNICTGTKKITVQDVEELSYRERTDRIFEILREIFKANTIEESRSARNRCNISDDLLGRWIEENIPRTYTDKEDIANAFERLSRADIFNGRIMYRQHYGFLRYSSELMTSGVALSRSRDYHGFVPFKFPTLLSALSASKGARGTRKAIAEKMKKPLHSSTKEIISEDFPFLKMLFANKQLAAGLSAHFDFTEKEISFLSGKGEETKAVKEIFQAAQNARQLALKEKRASAGHSMKHEHKQSEEQPKHREEQPSGRQTSLL